MEVSTHSRPKAAGWRIPANKMKKSSFNTQPPEGGWKDLLRFDGGKMLFQHTAARRRLGNLVARFRAGRYSFNTQPPEGGWLGCAGGAMPPCAVSTHSRPKAAGGIACRCRPDFWFQHTAARRRLARFKLVWDCPPTFQHTAARRRLVVTKELTKVEAMVSTHSRPKAAGRIHIHSVRNAF